MRPSLIFLDNGLSDSMIIMDEFGARADSVSTFSSLSVSY